MPLKHSIRLTNAQVEFDQGFICNNLNWVVHPESHWLICGNNGSGKSALAAILYGAGEIQQGLVENLPERVGLVSFEAQLELIEAERRKDDADIMDVISEGTPVSEIIAAVCTDQTQADLLCEQFGLTPLLNRAFRKLSTGESRKVMLIRALTSNPHLLILDEPFEGLDVDSLAALKQHLDKIAKHTPIVMIVNRLDQCPSFVTDVAYMSNGEIAHQLKKEDPQAWRELQDLLHLKTSDLHLPTNDPDSQLPELNSSDPLVKITDGVVRQHCSH